MKPGAILMLGDVNIDTFWPVPEFPVPGRDGLVEEVKFEVGGAVLNSAILLDRLGVKTILLSCMGKDRWAECILEGLMDSSIDMTSIQIDPKATSGINFTIVTPDGERTMFTHRGANVRLDPTRLNNDVFRGAALLHISGYALLDAPQKDTVWRAVELAKENDVPISLDTGLEPVMKRPEDFRALIKMLTICITGPEEVGELYGSESPEEAAVQLLNQGLEIAAIKLGSKGSLVANQEKLLQIPSFEVDAVDSTGAGDSFSAGLVYGWVNGLQLEETGILASAIGALATTAYGAGMSLPTKKVLIAFLKNGIHPEGELFEHGLDKLMTHFLITDEGI